MANQTERATAPQRACWWGAAFLAACLISLVAVCFAPAHAWADYSFRIEASDAPSLQVGNEFTLSEVLEKVDDTGFTMYALSTAVSFDSSVIEYVSSEAFLTQGTVSLQNGAVVYNALAPMAGTVCTNPTTLCNLVFRVVGEGTTTLSVTRAAVSTYSGMASYPVVATSLTLTCGGAPAAQPTQEETVPQKADATQEDAGKDTPAAVAENVKADKTTAYSDGATLSKDDLINLVTSGMTMQDLQQAGFTDDEIGSALLEGLTATDLAVMEAAGYTTTQLKTYGYTDQDLADIAAGTGLVAPSESTYTPTEPAVVNEPAPMANNNANSDSFPVIPVIILVMVLIAVIGAVVVLVRKKAPSGTSDGEGEGN
ncbi:MAG: hypothetical protein Q4E12_01520 [Coriobacteriia bacterium]|nr:hypothetical protein [Coriobacteriia bacterium]